jgi:hypothetical protein
MVVSLLPVDYLHFTEFFLTVQGRSKGDPAHLPKIDRNATCVSYPMPSYFHICSSNKRMVSLGEVIEGILRYRVNLTLALAKCGQF